MFNDRSILITGGTGSFGKAFIGRLLKGWNPKRIVVYSRDEFKQYEMQQVYDAPCMRYFIGDVRDGDRLSMAMKGIDFVVHAAALKQVPAAEYNPMECIKTNVDGAYNVIQAAIANDVDRVVALSTDKAANPINLYGATKLCSDKLFTAANNLVGEGRTRFSVVRYGNVMGSRGSVIPFFKKLVEENAPEIPITHDGMTRFWITLPQGVDFVVKAFLRMQGGELFVPKIPSARVVDIATAIAPKTHQKTVGIRPGEKLHEIMCPLDDARNVLEFEDHFVITPSLTFQSQRDFQRNELGETGKSVTEDFVYSSGENEWFLTVEEIAQMIERNCER
ncbi:MAG: UDP-N-acetylglucosamine 4,6-dehydratase (inverting) [Synergistota bacterium]|nr:UDP-N-acetylglucosamine 4,6-dehydratase (inverting) [Synergistota bacterium]